MTTLSNTTRRRMLQLLGASALVPLAACVTASKNGGVTTITVNGAKALTDAQAVQASLTAILATPSLVAAMTADQLATAKAGLAAINQTVSDLQTAIPTGVATATIDTTTVQSLAKSLITDAQNTLLIVQNVLGVLHGTTFTMIGNYVSAALSLLPFLELAVGLVSDTHVPSKYSEAEAVAICHS